MNRNSEIRKRKNRRAFIISIIVFVVLLVACILYLSMCTPLFRTSGTGNDPTTSSTVDSTDAPSTDSSFDGSDTNAEPELPDNPIDFSEQLAINDEIYAWIRVPNTNVDYPILQSYEDDLFYLRRGLDKKYDLGGVIFTQSINSRDFSDPVTLVYGHNMVGYGDDMFCELHKFENKEFFDQNEYFYIYTPGHILKYYIVSAYKYDDRHIMNSFDFDDLTTRREYFDYVLNPTMIPMNVRDGAAIADDDKLVVLSTCMATSSYRYLVNGILVEDTQTK